jgi:hypothetical protein
LEKGFSVRLTDRNEVVEYRDDDCATAFDLGKREREWTLYLPGSREVTAEKERQIVERIIKYLSKIWWFGIFPCRYTVRVEHKQQAP